MVLHELLVAFLSLSLFVSPSISDSTPPEYIKECCSQSPYPGPCEFFLVNNPKYKGIKNKSDFLKASKELALERAKHAEINTNSLGPKCRNKLEKSAWEDCLELYEYTIKKLNESSRNECSKGDSQTWLSAALTYLQTCKTGFEELGVTDYIMPLMSNNVSKLISNSLALNKDNSTDYKPSYTDGFPTWVPKGDRKLLQAPAPPPADIVVAADGSGNVRTVNEAVAAAARRSGSRRYVIYVKAGIYRENVEIRLANIMLVGDGIGRTVITGSRSVGGGTTTFRSATVAVVGDGFIARGITFQNTAGPENHQAVALRSGSDFSVFYLCSFEGYQDTLYVHSERQFYRNCDIYGTVDFIFGNAAVVLQNCNIFARRPPNRTNTLTAQSRTDPNQNTGISIHNCRITASSELRPVQDSVRTYLGRPWQRYSRTVVMNTFIDSLVDPAGWMPWSGNFALNTLYYGEYMNTGPGSSTANRVRWGGYRVITSPTEASRFTVGSLIAGNSWLPGTNVPFTSGL